ncbi:MAG: 2-amino-4-hydroxy-6-hydroxymethyldihydropteridine diphosphokinase [Alphaproteobacteria bacterium]|nr:2-amino-4-hydroxy-6-hydroxymethyldihydropteridine diphosphokinase [Pseudomonadota bacterium]TDI63717.1 MAG: 2-amino-4-hydroxy-6-hydroxymethyldihydropteridine diphosphokinase [Alphaproteobacteria bacterium]
MILIGLGANLPSGEFGPPAKTLEAAMAAMEARAITVAARSPLYESAPVPVSDQPWFFNRVIRVETALDPRPLLDVLLEIERRFGRRRGAANAPRVLDLDLLAYDAVITGPDACPVLPHPRMHSRAFVLLPLAEIAPHWRHPGDGTPLALLIARLPGGQTARPCPPS